MSAIIRIDDLRTPRLTALQQQALEAGAAAGRHVDFSERGVLDAACARTGLADFGSADFLPRLRLLLDEWGSDEAMLSGQRANLFGYLVRYCSNRLLLQDFWQRNPQALETPLEAPIIVAGLPRSGTTHLVNLLAADTRYRSLPLWESYEPLPLPGEGTGTDGRDPRYLRCLQAWEGMQSTLPLLAAMHPMHPDHIHEELELMGPAIGSYNFEWLSHSPRWRDHYYATDQEPLYRYMVDVLKTLTYLRGPARWVLKCPQHMEQLPLLKRIFPQATVVLTHRDPVAVIQSSVTMIAYGERMRRARVDTASLLDYWSARIEHILRACVRDRATWPATQSIDLPFHTFMADATGALERIHALAGDGIPEATAAAFRAYLDAHPRGKEGRMVYDLEGDFGCAPARLRERFGFYFDAFPAVRAEV